MTPHTKQRVSPKQTPAFAGIEEAADWHDQHDTADLSDAVEVAAPQGAGGLSQVFSVRFDAATVERLAAAAARHQVGVTQLVRMWVLAALAGDEAVDDDRWANGLTDGALVEIRSILERTVATAAQHCR
jgi:hypothetical protein